MNCKLASLRNIGRRIWTNSCLYNIQRPQGIYQFYSCGLLWENNFTNPICGRHEQCTNNLGPCLQQSRSYAKKLSFSYSKDLTGRSRLDLKGLAYNYKGLADTIEKAPEVVHKISSLEYADGRDRKHHRLEEMYDRIEDLFGSSADLEQRIAKLTVEIRSLMPHCLKFRQDKYHKSRLVEKIQMRKKLLKYLRQDDYQHFLWLLRELRIRYVPTPEYQGQRSRKYRQKEASIQAASEVRKEKLAELQERLAAERVEFEKYKAKALAEIEIDIKELNLDRSLLEQLQHRKAMTVQEAKTLHVKGETPANT